MYPKPSPSWKLLSSTQPHRKLTTIDGRPWFAVEVNLNDTVLSPNLLYFRDRVSIPYIYQVVKKDKVHLLEKGGRIVSAGRFLAGLI